MGLLGMTMPVYSLFLSLVTLGLPTVLARFIAMDLSRGDQKKIQESKHFSFLLVFFPAALIALGLYFFSSQLCSLLYKDQRTVSVLRFLAPLLILTSFSLIYRGYYRGLGLTLPLGCSEIGGVLAESAYVLWGLLRFSSFSPQAGLTLIMSGAVYGEAITLLTLACWEKRAKSNLSALPPLADGPATTVRHCRARRLPSAQRRLLKNSLPLLLQELIHSVSRMADGVIIPRLLISGGLTPVQATKAAGFYWGLTLPIYFIPLVFLLPLTTIILPATARAGKDQKSLRRFWGKGRKLLLLSLVYGVLSVLLLQLSEEKISSAFFNASGSNRLLLMVLPALPFSAFNLLLTPIVEGLGKQGFLCRATLVGLLIKTAVTTALVPLPGYGITGAAWGFIINQIILSLLFSWKVWRLGMFTRFSPSPSVQKQDRST